MEKVIITINPKKDGETTYSLEGFSGTTCTDITSALTKGDEVKEQHLKAEYHNPENLPVYENEPS